MQFIQKNRRRLKVIGLQKMWERFCLLSVLLGLGLAGCNGYYEEVQVLSNDVSVHRYYPWVDENAGLISPLSEYSEVIVNGRAIRLEKSRAGIPDAVFVGCSRVFVEIHSGFGVFLYVLCSDGATMPLWDWTMTVGTNPIEEFVCEPESATQFKLVLRYYDLESAVPVSIEKEILLIDGYGECLPFEF